MEINQPALDFSLPDLEGRLHRLSDYRGRIVVINFWAVECPWVERADRELLSYLPEWGERVVLLAIAANPTEGDDLVAAVSRAHGLPNVLHGKSEVLDAYGVQTTPQLYVIDAVGLLRYRGAFDDVTFRQRTPSRPYLKDAVERLLSGRSPDPAETPPYGCAVVRYFSDSC